ncbi:TRAP-type C4-dicarboxylate transport system, small permease component [Tranquillimonas alkanivorans]|uniref:TRAP transporter small permease protein n=2 Tax=Tranquillimonas alkanivorans TaxID=441119 RepID=A0A1I5W9A4_9RHOB|nr:TRAP-type C4-dicarboxylate transport system, small permease component [Tranquillimonas alkanivorans]
MSICNRLSQILFAIGAYLCLPAILVLLSADVVLRYFFSAPIRWAQEAATVTLFLSLVFALPQSWLKDAHIRADFLAPLMGRAFGEALARLVWLLVLALSATIAVQCYKDIQLMVLFNERSSELALPLSWFRGALGGTAVLCGLLSLAKLVQLRPVARPIHGDSL